jgi:ApbE superfamily uncharacterized protein (UPF0280 family)
MYQERLYRKTVNHLRFHYFRLVVLETDLWIGIGHEPTDELLSRLKEKIKEYRSEIENFGRKQPWFLKSLIPIPAHDDMPPVVKEMCEACQRPGVGPMAAVAGVMAERVGRYLEETFPDSEIIIENGGDIWAKFRSPLTIRVDAGKSDFSGKLGILITPDLSPCGICTSSGTVGHSLSFGKADAVTIVSPKAAVADAWATSICNKIQTKRDLKLLADTIENEEQIVACLAIIENQITAVGAIELMPLKVSKLTVPETSPPKYHLSFGCHNEKQYF